MISSQSLGERIARARKRATLTQAELGARMNMARTTIVAIEKGERRPSSEEVVRLAAVLELTVNELLRESAVHADAAPRFRMPRGADPESTAVVAAVEHLRKLGSRYVELERLLEVTRRPATLEVMQTYRATEGTSRAARDGEDAARTMRSLFGLADEPALTLDERFESEGGFRIFYLDDLPATVGGIFLWSEELGTCVSINAKHPHERRRSSLVHEGGHFLRDREKGDVFTEGDEQSTDASEVFCESFSRGFLLPANGVSRHFTERYRANGSKFTSIDILELARFYEVSFQAAALRLEELRLLRPGTYERLCANKIGPRRIEEHAGLKHTRQAVRPRKFPERYLRLAFLAFEEDLLGEGDLAEYLETDRLGARELYQDFREVKLDDGGRIELDLGQHDLSAP